ncbi:MAG: alanine--tRNA ligase [Clostridia bacterium]|nr:alanine--tRNA ligase [Deltaproteobacteria bacterium]
MTTTTSASIRRAFLDYFAKHGHTEVKSSPLVPQGDATLMFTNAGMVQFKDVFTGQDHRPYKRATTAQKCMRVSGKHNDLEAVGRTTRHHTLFEMLGNFSFGDYFKEQAIELAWNLSVRELGLDPSRIWVTTYKGAPGVPADDEARTLWRKIAGLPEERIVAMGEDNFWAMGDNGPCGPCTEIYFDTGSGPVTPDDFENGRIIEFWNNVFMQFDRQNGVLTPLPKPSVDTGMGLERLCRLLQGVDSNYHTDLFMPILEQISSAVGKSYTRSDKEDDVSMRVIADHARSTAFLVADGVQPANEGRGYVLRRIMRRAIRHGKRLGFTDVFFERACAKVVELMGEAYPELVSAKTLIRKVADLEERSFRRTIDTGLKLLDDAIAGTSGKVIAGNTVFKLYDTYGFPKDLTEVIAGERGFTVDEPGFERAMAAQQERSRAGDLGVAGVATIYKELRQRLGVSTFVGYALEDAKRDAAWRTEGDFLQTRSTVTALLQKGLEVQSVSAGEFEVVMEPTPFYGESGGQVGDSGALSGDGISAVISNTQKPADGLFVSSGALSKGVLKVGDQVWVGYSVARRKEIRTHHSATHLLHGSLREILGDHVKQAGSLVDDAHLRFDYSHFEAPTQQQMRQVEDNANARVASDYEVVTEVLPFEEARKKGAMMLFGEKYGDVVRVVTMGESVEFCGGTHAARTGDLGMVLVTGEEAVSSGVRRIEAESGKAAYATTRATHARLSVAADLLSGLGGSAGDDQILLAIAKSVRTLEEQTREIVAAGGEAAKPLSSGASAPTLPSGFGLVEARVMRDVWRALVQLANARNLEAEAVVKNVGEMDSGGLVKTYYAVQQANRDNAKRLDEVKRSHLKSHSSELLAQTRDVGGVKLLAVTVSGVDAKALRDVADDLRSKVPSGILVLGAEADGKAALLIMVTKDLTSRFQAGKLIAELAPIVGGRGGGKPEMAQAGGTDPSKLAEVYAKAAALVEG